MENSKQNKTLSLLPRTLGHLGRADTWKDDIGHQSRDEQIPAQGGDMGGGDFGGYLNWVTRTEEASWSKDKVQRYSKQMRWKMVARKQLCLSWNWSREGEGPANSVVFLEYGIQVGSDGVWKKGKNVIVVNLVGHNKEIKHNSVGTRRLLEGF